MRFSDLIRDLDLESCGVAALLLFTVAFLAVAWRTLSPRRGVDYDQASRLPLEEKS